MTKDDVIVTLALVGFAFLALTFARWVALESVDIEGPHNMKATIYVPRVGRDLYRTGPNSFKITDAHASTLYTVALEEKAETE